MILFADRPEDLEQEARLEEEEEEELEEMAHAEEPRDPREVLRENRAA